MDLKRVLFVCTGNICRSPTAEGIARHFIQTGGLGSLIEVDSAGTHGYHVGEAPDPRTRKAAQQRGYDLSALRARKLEVFDFQRFDLILAMDSGHLEHMRRLCPEVYLPRLGLFMAYARDSEFDEVPDPYYGGPRGFDVVLDMCESGVRGLLESLTAQA
ncbi:PtpA protein [Thauera linaloolentis 47Lol = DSM 12138]|uniref:protein-tyrosine-phosphatase n=1 Tax=Thauera linaloolentis (strain DSM 12138 / JCM 21573 / CCUG 41526 / CIP 105981 / IAM 15112 / NBRC 102519 / 47Lol) TaxID=1123367 RepID=N6YM16_THAL4|nr:PtpA protein [Thauera linaloolentis 47Lol = DSM 12138]